MRIKQKPEDFSVKESYRFDEVPDGQHRVYLMDKQKVSTYDAVERIRTKFGLKPGSVSYCGLKDKQGRTEQIIAVDGKDVEVQDPDLRLRELGRTDRPLSAANITSNRFSVTVRALTEDDLGPLNLAVAEVNRLGVVNYFDSQRFGSLKHGQGFIAKDLIRGDFEAALKNYLAKPSPLDRTEDAKIKEFWRLNWGEWDRRVPFEGVKRYFRILESLRRHPNDYVRAFLQIDKDYRAMQLFTYQSYLWNEGVRRYLQLLLPREHLFPVRYQAGTLLFHRDADGSTLDGLRKARFPLLAPQSTFEDPKIQEAITWILGREKLKLEELRIEESPKLLFFKHEERPLVVIPQKLVIGRVQQDELNRGQLKVNVAFTLPPGAYATLVIKRLFHASWKEETVEDIKADQLERQARREAREAEQDGDTRFSVRTPGAERRPFDDGGGGDRKERRARMFGPPTGERGVQREPEESSGREDSRRPRAARDEVRASAPRSRDAAAPRRPIPATDDSALGRLRRSVETPVEAPRERAAPEGFRAKQKLKKAEKNAANDARTARADVQRAAARREKGIKDAAKRKKKR